MSAPRIGVLALQGAFVRHVEALQSAGADAGEVRRPDQLEGLDGIVIPGGESTTMSKLLVSQALLEPLAERLADGLPMFGTCAGLILASSEIIDGRPDQVSFGSIDLTVRRNGYGRQLASFEADLDVVGFDQPFRGVFIRAPKVERVGPGVEVLAEADGVPVLCRSDSVLVASFHPELTSDIRLHRLFIDDVVGA